MFAALGEILIMPAVDISTEGHAHLTLWKSNDDTRVEIQTLLTEQNTLFSSEMRHLF